MARARDSGVSCPVMTTTGTAACPRRARPERRSRSFRACAGRARGSPARGPRRSAETPRRDAKVSTAKPAEDTSRVKATRTSASSSTTASSGASHSIVTARYQAAGGRANWTLVQVSAAPPQARRRGVQVPGRRADARAFRQLDQIGDDAHAHLAHQVAAMELDRSSRPCPARRRSACSTCRRRCRRAPAVPARSAMRDIAPCALAPRSRDAAPGPWPTPRESRRSARCRRPAW